MNMISKIISAVSKARKIHEGVKLSNIKLLIDSQGIRNYMNARIKFK